MKWIDATKRKPKPLTDVLAFRKRPGQLQGKVFVAWTDNWGHWLGISIETWRQNKVKDYDLVTHWQPLPALPPKKGT